MESSLSVRWLCDTCEVGPEGESRSTVSNSLWPHGLFSPWNSPGQNTGVGSLSLLQGIFPTQGSNPGLPHCRWILYQLSHEGSPRILEWVAYPFSRGSFQPRNRTRISCIAGRFSTNWAIRETQRIRFQYGSCLLVQVLETCQQLRCTIRGGKFLFATVEVRASLFPFTRILLGLSLLVCCWIGTDYSLTGIRKVGQFPYTCEWFLLKSVKKKERKKLKRHHVWDFSDGPVAKVHTPNAGGLRSIPSQGTGSHMPQLRVHKLQQRSKIPSDPVKPNIQINHFF